MKYYLVAGEKSGDLHGANLIKQLKISDYEAEFKFCGGDLMLQETSNISLHINQMNFMGFVEVLLNIRTIKHNITKVKEDILTFQPDAVILIDYPGFNLRIAEYAHELGIKVFYYISPKVWAWKSGRIKKIKKWVNELYLILPFEEAFYAKHDVNAKYVGNPLLDAIDEFKQSKPIPLAKSSSKKTLALLPGSRPMEIRNILPVMIAAAEQREDLQVLIAGISSLPKSLYDQINVPNFEIIYDNTYQLLNIADVALVTSGTATLETALFNVPQVVCYKAHPLTIWIARKLVKIKFISLVNLIMDKEVVKELIQEELNVPEILSQLSPLIQGEKRNLQLEEYSKLMKIMGEPGASKRVAQHIYRHVKG